MLHRHTHAQVENAQATPDSAFQRLWLAAAFANRTRIAGRAASLMLKRKERLVQLADR